MDRMVSLSHGRVFASDHVVWVVDVGQSPVPTKEAGNGLIAVTQPAAAMLFTGISTGLVNVTVEARSDLPGPAEVAGWDEVCEVSMQAPHGQLAVCGPMAPNEGDLGWLSAAGPGSYRLRVHARGRDTNVDGSGLDPVEDYLFVSWPSPPAEPVVYKATDRYGAGRRERAERRRSAGTS